MKVIYILRHAKSSWSDNSLADFDRPLNSRGLNAAPFIGEAIARRNILLDVIISSPAKRAMETAILVKESAGSNAPIQYEERIYDASLQSLTSLILQIDDGVEFALIVGHNPGMEELVRWLTGLTEPMPTAAFASILLDIDSWAEITAICGKIEFVIRPSEEVKRTGNDPNLDKEKS